MLRLIVPPGDSGGVFDYACRLRDALGERHAAVQHLGRADSHDWKPSPGDTLYLQFSGYGYHRRGAPLWLVDFLQHHRQRIGILGVCFHELYAVGPPWSSAFWLSPAQRHIARQLVQLADFWVTNTATSGRWLRKHGPAKPHAVVPVFSTVGESGSCGSRRLPMAVIFGLPPVRRATYRALGPGLFRWLCALGLELHDIGAPLMDPELERSLEQNCVRQHGELTAARVSSLLASARYGLLAYPADSLAKSSVFAAYCAHGLCPVLTSEQRPPADRLTRGLHYLPAFPDTATAMKAEAVGEAARRWYMDHDVHTAADILRGLLQQVCRVHLHKLASGGNS